MAKTMSHSDLDKWAERPGLNQEIGETLDEFRARLIDDAYWHVGWDAGIAAANFEIEYQKSHRSQMARQRRRNGRWDLRQPGKVNILMTNFSLVKLQRENPGLAAQFLWGTSPMLSASDGLWINLGCGARSFEGFANVDIAPQDLVTTKWNFLDIWPESLEGQADGLFSEDCLEHFFHAEQTYILCNINWSMKSGGTAKILMPDLTSILNSSKDPIHPGDYLRKTYGAETAADVLNHALRFTGHRWIHSAVSMARMAEACGFESTVTDVAESEVPKLRGRNLRDGQFSLSTDLKKIRNIRRIVVRPSVGHGVQFVERISDEVALFVATGARPVVEYDLDKPLFSGGIACMNFRSSNTSVTDWNLKYLAFDDAEQLQWGFDETLKSQSCMNIITNSQMRIALGGDREFSKLRFTPSYQPGEYFTLGAAEIFFAE